MRNTMKRISAFLLALVACAPAFAAITRLTPVASEQAAATTIVVTLPTGIVNGTLLKMVVTQDITSGVLFATPTGWTLDSTDTITNGDHQTFYKLSRVSDGTDGTTISVTFAAAGHNAGAVVGGWNGCDTTTGSFGPGERDFSKNNPNSASAPSSPVTMVGTTITPNTGDELVYMGGVDGGGTNGVYSGLPGTFNTIVQTVSTDQFMSAMLADAPVSSGGATGATNATWTQSGGAGNFVVYFMALKSAGGAPPVRPRMMLQGIGKLLPYRSPPRPDPIDCPHWPAIVNCRKAA